jgi:alkylhydroperoxidase/carboxymuconolactone decarboxylase family protein YurZ
MMKTNFLTDIENLNEIELLALLSASSVLRKQKYLNDILFLMLKKKIQHKKIYEALLQTYLFAGFPSALISLKRFNTILTKEKKYTGFDLHKYLSRGKKNCRIIYGNKYEKLISNIKSFSPEMAEWLIIEGYGKVLGRKGLSLKEREICIVSVLAALKFKDQLYSHINGSVNCKVEISFLYKIIKNLNLISAKSASNFGIEVIKEFEHSKLKKSFLLKPQT